MRCARFCIFLLLFECVQASINTSYTRDLYKCMNRMQCVFRTFKNMCVVGCVLCFFFNFISAFTESKLMCSLFICKLVVLVLVCHIAHVQCACSFRKVDADDALGRVKMFKFGKQSFLWWLHRVSCHAYLINLVLIDKSVLWGATRHLLSQNGWQQFPTNLPSCCCFETTNAIIQYVHISTIICECDTRRVLQRTCSFIVHTADNLRFSAQTNAHVSHFGSYFLLGHTARRPFCK